MEVGFGQAGLTANQPPTNRPQACPDWGPEGGNVDIRTRGEQQSVHSPQTDTHTLVGVPCG